ncbi:MAG: hypothetical protein L3J82_01440 [Planctomycetes bacterium]|nr:hypothetical protein [Planctomycetota bacterium]
MPDSRRILIYRYLRAFSEYKTTQLAGRDGQHTFGKAKLGWVMHCMTANDGTSMTRLPEARGHPIYIKGLSTTSLWQSRIALEAVPRANAFVITHKSAC